MRGWRLSNPKEIVRAQGRVVREVHKGQISPAVARAMTAALANLLRGSELLQLESKLAEYEAILREKGLIR